jgi:hypothetical protein
VTVLNTPRARLRRHRILPRRPPLQPPGIVLELLTADRDLANARFAMIQSTADLLTASAAVAYAIGAVEKPERP